MRRWGALWFVAISLLSLAPLRIKSLLGTLGILHNAGHFVVFAICGLIALAGATTPRSRVQRFFLTCLLCAALEFLQTVIYHNAFEWDDLAIDYLALGISPWLLYAWNAFIERSRQSHRFSLLKSITSLSSTKSMRHTDPICRDLESTIKTSPVPFRGTLAADEK